MTQARRDIFLKSTNTNRNIIAKGQLPGSFKDKTAEDMAEIVSKSLNSFNLFYIESLV